MLKKMQQVGENPEEDQAQNQEEQNELTLLEPEATRKQDPNRARSIKPMLKSKAQAMRKPG